MPVHFFNKYMILIVVSPITSGQYMETENMTCGFAYSGWKNNIKIHMYLRMNLPNIYSWSFLSLSMIIPSKKNITSYTIIDNLNFINTTHIHFFFPCNLILSWHTQSSYTALEEGWDDNTDEYKVLAR